MSRTSARPARRARARRRVALAAAAVLGGTLLAACSEEGKPVLTWYINPDGVEVLDVIAERCSTDQYDIETELLPTGATDQRIQLARRLAAEDDTTDLMNLDPVFVPEFANAGWLEEMPDDVVTEDTLDGIAETVRWDDRIYAIPLWANTQVLWYRKSLAEEAGLDMSQPVTWDQVIDAASSVPGATVGVQANKYEAYVVWINALVQGAGGEIISDVEAGKDASVDIDSEAGRAAAAVIEKLAKSRAAQSDLSVSNEGTSLPAMFAGPGEFMTNWTFVYKNYAPSPENGITEEQYEDLGWARYPRTVPDMESRPPVGGIDVGVGAFSKHRDFAVEAAQCITDTDSQVALAVDAGLMPATATAYEAPELAEAYPPDLLELFRESVDSGGPRPKSAYYATISSAIQSVWHSPDSVDESTPKESADFLAEVLEGKALL
ncbi:extracellular solute-binding protein [Nocardioides dongkuii]|uniref:extracellular solute-binding protein n=1 Tax=Nocardioides dongkuii TaxID=2760089 RepID=UPI00187893A1|nr:extracellular solute-binding protein [Nocardioides dongkuii]